MKKVYYVYHPENTHSSYNKIIYLEEKDFTIKEIIQQIRETYPKRTGRIDIITTEDGYEPYVIETVRYRKVR